MSDYFRLGRVGVIKNIGVLVGLSKQLNMQEEGVVCGPLQTLQGLIINNWFKIEKLQKDVEATAAEGKNIMATKSVDSILYHHGSMVEQKLLELNPLKAVIVSDSRAKASGVLFSSSKHK